MALIICKECGTEFSDKAKACTKCGSPPKKKTSFITWVITICLGLWFIGYISDIDSPTGGSISSQEVPKPAQSAYPTKRNLDYRSAALGQMKEGTLLTFTGKVLQVIDSDNVRIATKREEYIGYSGDDVFLVFETTPQILEDDIIKVMGRYDGTLKYETVLRSERVIPQIQVDYFTVVKTQK